MEIFWIIIALSSINIGTIFEENQRDPRGWDIQLDSSSAPAHWTPKCIIKCPFQCQIKTWFFNHPYITLYNFIDALTGIWHCNATTVMSQVSSFNNWGMTDSIQLQIKATSSIDYLIHEEENTPKIWITLEKILCKVASNMKTNLFGLYKQYKDQACLYIDEEVVHVPMTTTAGNGMVKTNLFMVLFSLTLIWYTNYCITGTCSRNSGNSSYICLSSSNYMTTK